MILQLRVPPLPAQFVRGEVRCWHKSIGETVEFGDAVLDLAITERLQLRRPHRPQEILSGRAETHPYLVAKSVIVKRLYAADRGVLRAVLAPAGARWEAGVPLGLLAERADEPIDGPAGAAVFRVAVNDVQDL